MLSVFERISENAARFTSRLSGNPWLCLFLSCGFGLVALISIRGVVSGLFTMHRSKSAAKKVLKNYPFLQKLLLRHAWQECLHASRFCRFLIIYHHLVVILILIEALLVFLSGIWPGLMPFIAWYASVFSFLVAVPACILAVSLDRYPFHKRKHEFRFKKYHNTSDHSSLW